VANTLDTSRNGAVGFIAWLDLISPDKKNKFGNVKPAMTLLHHDLLWRRRELCRPNRLSYNLRNRAIRRSFGKYSDARYLPGGINAKREMNVRANVSRESIGCGTGCAINHV
jgi:hypothetical protein